MSKVTPESRVISMLALSPAEAARLWATGWVLVCEDHKRRELVWERKPRM